VPQFVVEAPRSVKGLDDTGLGFTNVNGPVELLTLERYTLYPTTPVLTLAVQLMTGSPNGLLAVTLVGAAGTANTVGPIPMPHGPLLSVGVWNSVVPPVPGTS